MAAYYKVEVSLNANSVTVGSPSPQQVRVTIPLVGPQGPEGAQGPQGPAGEVSGSIDYANVTNKPATFPPEAHTHVAADVTDFVAAVEAVSPPAPVSSVAGRTGAVVLAVADVTDAVATSDARLSDARDPNAHAATHAAGGSDPLTPSSIGAQEVVSFSFHSANGVEQLPAARNSRRNYSNFGGPAELRLPITDNQLGDRLVIESLDQFISEPIAITWQSAPNANYITLATIDNANQAFSFLNTDGTQNGWRLEIVDTHTHPATDITSGTLNIARVPTGTTSTTVSLGDHTHELDALDATGATLGHVLTAQGDGTAAFAAAAGGGDEIADDLFRVIGSADASKKVAFEVDGLTTATTRTLTVPDQDGTLALTAQLTDTQIFTANGTWTKPAGAKQIYVELVGGGGGGGGGRRGATSTARGGGGGGAGAGRTALWLHADQLGATETVTVAAGGAAGAAAGDDENGGVGAAGGDSSFGPLNAFGGNGGNGGNASFVATGGAAAANRGFVLTTTHNTLPGGSGGYEGSSAGPGGNSGGGGGPQSAGGGGGSRITALNALTTAGAGGALVAGSGGVNPYVISFAAPGVGQKGITGDRLGFIASGASGGRQGSSGEGAEGGDSILGAGGGGGSAATNGAGGSNAGGLGGDGIVVITTYF